MKKRIFNKIFCVILGMFLMISFNAGAAILTAKDLPFKSADLNWKADNIETALNDLYTIKDSYDNLNKVGNATSSDILSGKTCLVNGQEVVGTVTSKNEETYIPGINDQIINSGQCLAGNQIIKGDANLAAGNIKAGTSIFGVNGTYTSDANATAAQILSGKTAYVNGSKITGTIASKAAATYTPTTSNQTIAANQYLSGVQTIKGDSNLVSGNIKAGTSIFGVSGTYTSDANATAAQILSGKTAYVNGSKITGSMRNYNNAWIWTSNGIDQYTYSSGTVANMIYVRPRDDFGNGYATATAKLIVGEEADIAKKVMAGKTWLGVTGTATSDANATAAQMLSGKTGYVNGSKITGTIASKGAATYTPGTSNQTIAASQYLSGTQTIKGDANLVAGNIKSGVTIFGVKGTYTPTASNAGIHTSTAGSNYCGDDWYLRANVAAGKYIVTNFMRTSVGTGDGTNMSVYTSSTAGADSVKTLSSYKASYGVIQTYLVTLNSARTSGTAMGRMSNCALGVYGTLYGHSTWTKIG